MPDFSEIKSTANPPPDTGLTEGDDINKGRLSSMRERIRKSQRELRARYSTSFLVFSVLVIVIIVGILFRDVIDRRVLLLSFTSLALLPPLLLAMNYLQFGTPIVRQRDVSRLIIQGRSSSSGMVFERLRNAGTKKAEAGSNPSGFPRSSTVRTPEEEIIAHFVGANRVRLQGEITNLGRRGNLNLIIGIATTIVGVIVLGYVVFAEQDANTSDHWSYVGHFAMRLSIALFIEVFAYFFLRLYKSNLEDIRYYQNEMTNIEAKWSAVMVALAAKESALLKVAIESLSKTERNFTLKKGESTVGLERERMDKNEILDLVRETLSMAKAKNAQ